MCMCCDIPIQLKKFINFIELYDGLFYILISYAVITIIEVILTITGICGDFTEDILTDIIFYLAIAACAYATLWAILAYKKTTADVLLVTEYAVLMVPLPCLSLFGYTILNSDIFSIANNCLQLIFGLMSIYFALCIHSVYVEELHKDKEIEETA